MPPYCGAPSLFHQLPVAVVDVFGTVVGAVIVVVVVLVGVAVTVLVVAVVEVVVVDVAQDAKTSDISMRQVSKIQITFFFMQKTPLYFLIENL